MGRPTPPDRPRPSAGPGAERGRGGIAAGNPRIKRLRRLIAQRKARSQERAFVVEGPALVAEAVAGPTLRPDLAVESVLVEVDYRPPPLEAVLAAARDRGIEIIDVAPGVLGSTLDTRTPQPVVAVMAGATAPASSLGPDGPLVILVEPADPGNVGTVIRSAEAAGAAGVVVAGAAVDVTNPKVVRAAAGAFLRLPVVVEAGVEAALALAADTGRPVLATVVDPGAPTHDGADLRRAALVLGSEAHGLAPEVVAAADGTVTIPLAGPTESLNLAVAAGVLCFEAARQRRADDGAGDRPGAK